MNYSWRPQAGTQTRAITATWCEELFFGGARGGGKSDFLLGDFAQDVNIYKQHWHGILFRKIAKELDELIKRSHQIYIPMGAIFKVQDKKWIFPNSATLRLAFIERDEDADKYQGHQYCVGIDTPILMGGGNSKKIKDIKVGEFVATLEGAKEVHHVVNPYDAPCVKIVCDGKEQIQPIWHPVLTASGWQSYASLLGIDSKEFGEKDLKAYKLPSVSIDLKLAAQIPFLDGYIPKSTLYCVFYKHYQQSFLRNSINRHIDVLKSEDFVRTFLKEKYLLLQVDLDDAVLNALIDSPQELSFQEYCHVLYDFYGVPALYDLKIYQDDILKLNDVVKHNHEHFYLDVLDNIPSYNRQTEEYYQHPYDGLDKLTDWESSLKACEITYIGLNKVCDLSVDSANHYINSEIGIVNKNTWIGFDELPNWATDGPYNKLKACLRSAFNVPHKRIRSSGNPGGSGQDWIKQKFIDPAPEGFKLLTDVSYINILTGVQVDQATDEMLQDSNWKRIESKRMFIPSKLQDNKILMKNDPFYIAKLAQAGGKELVKAWLAGDWNAIEGCYFDDYDSTKHLIEPFIIPNGWHTIRAFDWGYSRPFCILWGAVSDGSIINVGGRPIVYPRGSIIIYREYYGTTGKPNEGIKINADEIAREAKKMQHEKIDDPVADPAIFDVSVGVSINEQMNKEGIFWRPADNKRVAGWQQIRNRLKGIDNKPLLYIFSDCKNLIRTLPIMQYDKTKPEDLDTRLEDHALDTLRYLVMSRPLTIDLPKSMLDIAEQWYKDFNPHNVRQNLINNSQEPDYE